MPALVRHQKAATEDHKRVAFQIFCLNSNLYNKQTAPLAVHDVRLRTHGSKEEEEEEEGFYKFLPANTADRLCQLWQSCSNHHEI